MPVSVNSLHPKLAVAWPWYFVWGTLILRGGQRYSLFMQAQEQTYFQVYHQLLNAPDLQPLTRFRTTRSASLLYPEALRYPDFFNQNLLNPGRVIKVVRGKSALTRAFAYHLMKLTFEIDCPDVDYVEVLKSVVFHPGFLQDDTDMQSPISGRGCTDRQYKRIIAEFIELMATEAIPNFEFTLMEYPIVDEALTRTLESITARCYTGELSASPMLHWLTETFAMSIKCFGKCYMFEESDIFLYQQNEQEYYIAFRNQMAQMSDYSESTYRFEDIKRSDERRSITERDDKESQPEFKGSSPDLLNLPEDDLVIGLFPDRFRNSAEPLGRRSNAFHSELEEKTPLVRKTFSNPQSNPFGINQVMKELGREVDESIHNDKPSDHSKPSEHSKIGSLLDIMSERSRQDLGIPYKLPEISSSRNFSEEDRRLVGALTTRTTAQPKQQQFQLKEITEQQLYASGQSSARTPQFMTDAYLSSQLYKDLLSLKKDQPLKSEQRLKSEQSFKHQQHYNPFSKKYSEQYMGNFYDKHFQQISDHQESKFYNDYTFTPTTEISKGQHSQQLTPKYNSPAYISSINNDRIEVDYKFNNKYQDNYSFNKYSQNYNPHQQEDNSHFKTDYDHLSNNKYTASFTFNRLADNYNNNHQTYIPAYKQQPYLSQPQPHISIHVISPSYSTHKQDDEDMLYRPKGPSKVKSSVSEAPPSLQDSKGTIYREFTDTKVLQAMTPTEKVRTNTIRQRFRGVHRRDLVKRA